MKSSERVLWNPLAGARIGAAAALLPALTLKSAHFKQELPASVSRIKNH